MADFVLNIAKGAFAEKFRDGAANGIVLLLSAAEVQTAFADHDDLAGPDPVSLVVASEESFVIGMNPHVAAAKRPEVEAALGVVDCLDEGFRRVVPLELESGEPSGNINEIRRLPEEVRG